MGAWNRVRIALLSPPERAAALRQLAGSRLPADVDTLLFYLGDPDAATRRASLETLRAIGQPAIDRILQTLTSRSTSRSAFAIGGLFALDHPDRLALTAKALAGRTDELRREAFLRVVHQGDRRASELLAGEFMRPERASPEPESSTPGEAAKSRTRRRLPKILDWQPGPTFTALFVRLWTTLVTVAIPWLGLPAWWRGDFYGFGPSLYVDTVVICGTIACVGALAYVWISSDEDVLNLLKLPTRHHS